MMGRPLLAALCIWSCALTVTPLTEKQVGAATGYIMQKFTRKFDYQYAYFVKFTDDECNKDLSREVLNRALRSEKADRMFREVDNYGIYEGTRMVAASFRQRADDCLHAEYRLLDSMFSSPISRLLSKTPKAGCVIFYSLNSPCTEKCIDPAGGYNIMNMLDFVSGLPQNKAFAFGQVYREDKRK